MSLLAHPQGGVGLQTNKKKPINSRIGMDAITWSSSKKALGTIVNGANLPWFPHVRVPQSLSLSHMRAICFATLDNDTGSIVGRLLYCVMMCLIVTSIVTFCISTQPEIRVRDEKGEVNDIDRTFGAIDVVLVAVFSAEYLLRLMTVSAMPGEHEAEDLAAAAESEALAEAREENAGKVSLPVLPVSYNRLMCSAPAITGCVLKLASFIFSPLNIIDVVAIAPFYVQLAFSASVGVAGGSTNSLTLLRAFRLARVLKMLRLSRRISAFRLLERTLWLSLDALAMLLYILLLAVILFGSIIFFCEAGEFDPDTETFIRPNYAGTGVEESPFRSIPVSFWWAIVSVTTVGYGDLTPTTACGRTVGSAVIVSGILVLAMPITIIGANFNDEFVRYKTNVRSGGDGFTPFVVQSAVRSGARAHAYVAGGGTVGHSPEEDQEGRSGSSSSYHAMPVTGATVEIPRVEMPGLDVRSGLDALGVLRDKAANGLRAAAAGSLVLHRPLLPGQVFEETEEQEQVQGGEPSHVHLQGHAEQATLSARALSDMRSDLHRLSAENAWMRRALESLLLIQGITIAGGPLQEHVPMRAASRHGV